MDNKENNKQIAKISVFITSVFVIFLSISYAFLTSTLTSSKSVVINAGVLDLVLEEENEITLSNTLPMYDEVGMIQDEVFNFKLINNTDNPTNYKLMLNKISTSNELSTDIVKYYLTKDGVGTPKLLSTISSDNVVDEGTIEGNKTINYSLRLWIDSSVDNNSSISGKNLSYKVSVEVSQEIEKEKVTILGKTFELEETSATFPDFSNISSETNGRGIYKYTEDGEDIYYWRGAVTDNHVIFGGYCWEMIRTTKTGGVKMIYDGEPVDGKCTNTGTASNLSVGNIKFNTNYNDNAYVGYMYGLTGLSSELSNAQCIKLSSSGTSAEVGSETDEVSCELAGGKWVTTAYEATHANVVNSNIKTTIDNWFSTSNLNTSENLEKIEDTVYCNDRSIDTVSGYGNGLGYGTNKTVYNAGYRLKTNKTPSLECANVNDRFTVSESNGNGALTYPVGLITADEIALAGGVYFNVNSDYYLYTGSHYWASSPYYFNGSGASEFFVVSNGYLGISTVFNPYGARPVVSLASGSKILSGGDGTEANPYVVE